MTAAEKQWIVHNLDMEDWPLELVLEYRWYQITSEMYADDALSDDEFEILSDWAIQSK